MDKHLKLLTQLLQWHWDIRWPNDKWRFNSSRHKHIIRTCIYDFLDNKEWKNI